MESIKIQEHRHIQLCFALFFMVLFSVVLAFLLVFGFSVSDWMLDTTAIVGICVSFSVVIFVPICVFFILRAVNKTYYIISSDGIKRFVGDQEIFNMSASDIIGLQYLGFRYMLLFQMGSGYLHIQFAGRREQGIKPSMTYPTGDMVLSIDMSAKQAKKVAAILHKNLSNK